MATHDYVIANGTGAAVRSDLNAAFAAIVSQNSNATEPSPTYAYMSWADTTAGVMKLRNGANNAWITLYQLDGEWSTIAFENGTAAAPSIYFKDSGTDTGIYSPGADQIGIATAGLARLNIDASGRVGLGGITAPTAALQLAGQTTLTNASDAVGTKIVNTSAKTYPAAGGTVFGSLETYNIANTTSITTPLVTFVANRIAVQKTGGNVQDIEGFSITVKSSFNTWTDLNTCKNYAHYSDVFVYGGIDANSRTSSNFSGPNIIIGPPDSGTQTIATIYSDVLQVLGVGTSTVNVTNWGGTFRNLRLGGSGSGTKTYNITNASFYDISASWGVVSGATITAAITNLYGLRLPPPASTTGLTITNNWGLYQEWSPAKNWLAAESNQFPNITTTASSANVFVDSADSNRLYRSTSSSVYKKNVESLDAIAADKILDLRPVWYRSKCQNDRKDWSWYGLIAEEVAQIDPRFVHYGYQEDAYELVDVKQVVTLQEGDPRRENGKETEEIVTKQKQLKKDAKLVPNGIAYERLTVPLIDIVKRQQELINDLLARVSALEAAVS